MVDFGRIAQHLDNRGYFDEKRERVFEVKSTYHVSTGETWFRGKWKYVADEPAGEYGWKSEPKLPKRSTEWEAEQDLEDLAEKRGWHKVKVLAKRGIVEGVTFS